MNGTDTNNSRNPLPLIDNLQMLSILKVDKQYLCVPATSVVSEGSFSSAGGLSPALTVLVRPDQEIAFLLI